MDARKRRVLQALVTDYIATAEPVGSRTLVRKYGLGVSSATVRNEMADLEEAGYLEQPHTSAGRIPSDKGYRYYVDELMPPAPVDRDTRDRIRAALRTRVREIRWLLHQAGQLVSAITHYPTVVLGPGGADAHLLDLRVVPLEGEQVLLVLQTSAGLVQTRTVSLPPDLDPRALAALAEDFTRRYQGTPVKDLGDRVTDLEGGLRRHRRLWEALTAWLHEWGAEEEDRITVSGLLNILAEPEFRDVSRVRRVLGFLERDGVRLLEELAAGEGTVSVAIGAELGSYASELADALAGCSVISATYTVGGETLGQVVVIGPTRMYYARVMAVLDVMAGELSRALKWA
ncbi:Heat-inducible transcription repressor HrcA [Candidatus Hydrogenisulfobacillus filiaventi]|uniref:Heat-inducible transcription repressor HrcA n=1 Tax=Candidatus Hydrogenisulfobacillus filiaventi TaxID=2707344 RepID=A0A6F8ZIN4_9FIRM|nr:heat-inducible transcriptional repressor HrcA [Bacillota bacterium]CAB1129636.1 Heat-inducible transcription repressor HrcA [Candidatus Hydrogenisulfobacillus filiaventi]